MIYFLTEDDKEINSYKIATITNLNSVNFNNKISRMKTKI